MKIGIVGHEAKKFTPEKEEQAREIIRNILDGASLMVSGGCHLGGVDIWAEQESDRLGVPTLIFLPKQLKWEGGYKQRNLEIARNSDVVHCIVVKEYPPGYDGMKFDFCYHCGNNSHIKSGGCWTAWRCERQVFHII